MTTASAAPSQSTGTFEHLIVTDPGILGQIREVYASTYYRAEDAEFLKTPSGQGDLDFNAFVRYNQSVRHALPWVNRVFPLRGKSVLEVGCGTGSSTAAFAQVASAVHTCDVDTRGLETARQRLRLLNIDNVTIDPVGAPAFFDIASKYRARFDVVLLFAVLEHQTLDERLATLRRSWEMLEPGGILVVIETPNRLVYFDSHTMQQPFWGMIEPQMLLRCRPMLNTPRSAMVMDSILAGPADQHEIALTRWGRGISFHDVDMAIPPAERTVVADGYEREILDLFAVTYDERLLQAYIAERRLDVSSAFARSVLCFIMKKDGSTGTAPHRNFSPLVGSAAELKSLRDNVPNLSPQEIQRWLDHMIQHGTGYNYGAMG